MTNTPRPGRRVSPDATTFAAILAEYDKRLKALERSSSLARSSIENGSLKAKVDGATTMIVGAQYDGTNAAVSVTGPNPPVPTAPTLTPKAGAATVHWDGLWEPDGGDDQVVAPMDFARVEIHASTDPGFPADTIGSLVGTYETPRGGDTIVPIPTTGEDYVIKLVARSLSGKRSVASVGAVVQANDVDGNNTYRGPTPPWPDGDPDHVSDEGDMWYDTTLSDGPETRIHRTALTANVATLTVDQNHGIEVGDQINVFGVDEPFVTDPPSQFTVVSIGELVLNPGDPDEEERYDTISYAVVAADVPEEIIDNPEANVQGVATGEPLNRPSIWDGDSWVVVQDNGIDLALSLINKTNVQVSTNAGEIAQTATTILSLQNTSTDIQNIAYAADGRINISDYEPTASDMLDAAGQPKNEGSLWITRTRDRRNYCINSSFETGTSPWTYANAAGVRTLAAPGALTGEGAYMLRVTNTGAVGDHTVTYPDVDVEEGQEWTVSGHVAIETGSGVGCTVAVEFRATSGGPVIGTAIIGDPEDAGSPLNQWERPYVGAMVPPTATKMRTIFNNPNPSDVWQLDAVLIELNPRLGRYFDGGSEGGSWTGTANASISELDGGAIIRFYSLEDGGWKEKFWTKDTINSLNPGVLVGGNGYVRPAHLFTDGAQPKPTPEIDGALIADQTIPIDKIMTDTVQCAADVFAGALVNVTNYEGNHMVRLASAVPNREANGFVLDAAQTGEWVLVYSYGYNPLQPGLSPGPQFLSSDPGLCTSKPPAESGTIVQRVGFASDDSTLHFAALTSIAIT